MEREQLINTVKAVQNGDNSALSVLFNEYYNDVYYFALKTVKENSLAEDVTQETFIEIINTIGNLKEPAAFPTWIKTITYHQCTRYFKKKKDVIVSEDEEGGTIFDTLPEEHAEFIPDKALDQKSFKKTILSMLDDLSEEQRSAIMMYYFYELSVKQIADIQGVSEGTVKSRLNYGRKALKTSVDGYEKKHNVKLHSFSILPLFGILKWVLDGVSDDSMSASAVKGVAKGIASATGTTIATSTAGSGAASKIISSVVAAAITIGGGATAAIVSDNDGDTSSTQSIVSTVDEGSYSSQQGDVDPYSSNIFSSDIFSSNFSNSMIVTPQISDNLDYAAIIDSFVPSKLNTIELIVGEAHSPGASLYLQTGGSAYSSDQNVVTVSPYGKVTAVGVGTAYVIIAASGGGIYQTYRYDVFAPIPEADISNLPTISGIDFKREIESFNETKINTYTLKVGDMHTPNASNWAKSGGKCYTSDSSVITIAANGNVTAHKAGTAYVIITAGQGNMYSMYKYKVK